MVSFSFISIKFADSSINSQSHSLDNIFRILLFSISIFRMFCSIKEALLGSISMHEGRTRSEATFLYCVMTERKSSLSRRYLNAPIFVLSQTRVIIQLTGINLRHFFKSGESHSLRIVSVTKMTALFHNAWQRRVVYICDIVFTRFLFTEP